ncbi:type 1 glutamine amidotransferase [Shinella sp. 838]|uniref:type 1 glutamine amidotransferase n=1 Tax=Shinella sp. 838 TaxID=3038164 RepID=UPI00241558ED|nr:type 1 glutamine amidotransferase [Shinella sp. 838]MDG4675996.1 type 1 glutamine amidotransferase [Shinella sp. 838]
MKRTLLFLQNGTECKTVSKLEDTFASHGLDIDYRWAYDGDFPNDLSAYSGIFVSGSPHGAYEDIPFIHREHELLQQAERAGIPMLGICFGSQILASALCGRAQVFRRSFCEVGYKWLNVSEAAASDPIANSLGDQVYMFVWHNDEVAAAHPDMTILASTDLCPNHIWRYRDRPIWGIQGHPEISREQAAIWFEENRSTLEKDGADVEQLKQAADDVLPAKTMITKFARYCLA